MFTDLQTTVADTLMQTLKSDSRFDWVERITDYLEPKLMLRSRLFVKFRDVAKDQYWAIYIRKNICEVYPTSQLGWTLGRSKSVSIKMTRGKVEKPIARIIEDILKVIEGQAS